MSLKKHLQPNSIMAFADILWNLITEINWPLLFESIKFLSVTILKLKMWSVWSNIHILSHYSKQTYFVVIVKQIFLATPNCDIRYSFLRNILLGLHIYHFFHKHSLESNSLVCSIFSISLLFVTLRFGTSLRTQLQTYFIFELCFKHINYRM